MLTAMIQVDPTVYYAGRNPTLDNTFYNPDLNMSMAQSKLEYLSIHKIVDDNNEELARPYAEQYETGKLYQVIMNEYSNYERKDMYFVDDTPFETTLQIVGGSGHIQIAQDLFPDETLHFGCSPHYVIYPSDSLKIMTTLDISKGRFTGRFTFKKRGKSIGLTLA